MNYRMIFSTVGKVALIEAGLLLLPLLTAVIYGEWWVVASFGITIAVALAIYLVCKVLFKPKSGIIFSKEGLVTVSLAWIIMSLIGCLPFIISGEIPDFADALFETVSGFTTTGASVLTDVEKLSHGSLFWRSFTHWIGGMGVLVFVMAVTKKDTDRSIHILRAEMPGPTVDKLVPRAKDTAKILYLIYVVLTAVLIILLICGKMPVFDSIVHAFGTAGTGGFGIKNSSIAGYNNYCQWVIAIFMFIFGINFNLYYLILLGKFKDVLKSGELWAYFAIVGVSVVVVTLNILSMCNGFGEALRLSAFQVTSIISTSGFSTANFDLWPSLSKGILFTLMFIGGCAGSTAGGFKVSRIVLVGKNIRRELRRSLHPRNTSVIKFNGKRVDESTINGVNGYLAIYVVCIAVITLLLSIEPFNLETNFSATVACFNNVGPGFSLVGPSANYSIYSPFSKILLSLAMLLGRLEIYPILLTLLPKTWIKK
ncbi:MAG: TrkH family potassium uptake protein [Clostridiales bacterium]|nr:TrkH family potassium uptake protein [Clostridiales bacterium]